MHKVKLNTKLEQVEKLVNLKQFNKLLKELRRQLNKKTVRTPLKKKSILSCSTKKSQLLLSSSVYQCWLTGLMLPLDHNIWCLFACSILLGEIRAYKLKWWVKTISKSLTIQRKK